MADIRTVGIIGSGIMGSGLAEVAARAGNRVDRAPDRVVGWSFARRFALVTQLLQNPLLDVLLEQPVPFGCWSVMTFFQCLESISGDE